VQGPFIAASDNVRLVPDQIRQWMPGDYVILGTDGFGRSDTRKVLRRHFEIDAECTVYATLEALSRSGQFDRNKLAEVLGTHDINPEKIDPRTA
jgi:pyruvate dehydrogenase E1 component